MTLSIPSQPGSDAATPCEAAPSQDAGAPATKSAWPVEQVVSWLGSMALGHVAPQFVANGVDGSFLSELTEEDLANELGLSKLQARKVSSRWSSL